MNHDDEYNPAMDQGMSEPEPLESAPAGPSSLWPQGEPPKWSFAPRELTDVASSMIVKRFATWMILAMVLGGGFLAVGYWFEGDFRDLQSVRYEGEIVEALAGNILQDEDGQWADVAFEYNGEWHEASQIDITESQFSQIYTSAEGIGVIQLAFFPEEINDPLSIEWIDEQGPILGFAWAYYVAAGLIGLFLLLGIVKTLEYKELFGNGQVLWAEQVSDLIFDGESSTYKTTVSYNLTGESMVTSISWSQAGEQPYTNGQNFLIIANVKKPRKAILVTDKIKKALGAT